MGAHLLGAKNRWSPTEAHHRCASVSRNPQSLIIIEPKRRQVEPQHEVNPQMILNLY